MRYATKAFAFVIPLLIVAARPGLSQPRWSGELTGDAAFATQTLAGADLRTGGGFGVNARYRLQPHLSAYAGWEWHLQQSTELLPEQTVDLNDTGYALGFRFEHPLVSGTAVWVRAGGLYNHIEVENEGDATHNLTIEGLDVDEDLQPGKTTDVSFDAEPGTYKFHCEYHPSKMKGTITVS